jgi:hypothetical protein
MVSARRGAARTPAQLFALVLGIVYVVIGLLGFIPALAPNAALLGLFGVNATHNVTHLLVGAIWLFASRTPGNASLANLVIGIVYVLLGLLGLLNLVVPALINNNVADSWLHLISGAAAVYFGTAAGRRGVV